DHLGHVRESARAVVEPHALALVPGQAPALHRGPVRGVADDRAVTDRNLREVVPVARPLARRDVSVDQIQIEVPVVVEIAELRAPAPAAEIDAETRGEILELDDPSRPSSPSCPSRPTCPS